MIPRTVPGLGPGLRDAFGDRVGVLRAFRNERDNAPGARRGSSTSDTTRLAGYTLTGRLGLVVGP